MSSRASRFQKRNSKPQSNVRHQNSSKKLQSPTSTKKSRITELAQRPSYIIISLLISIFGALGGISGILQLKAYLKDEPGFKFHFTTIGVGTTGPVETGETFTSIIISGTIENDGTKALNINDEGFSLKVKKPDGTIVLARKLMLPQHLVALGDSSETDYKDTKDLQTVFKIPALETVSGSVYFFVSESRASIQTDGNVFIFYCTDLKGKVYSSEHTWMIKAGRNENRIYPQTGVKIFDKNIDSNSQKIPR